MNKLIITLLFCILALPVFAAEKGEMYLGPALGYHFFDDDHRLDDKAEGGLRLGYFFMDDHSVELEGDYTNTDHDFEGSTGATSLSLSVLKYFNIGSPLKPFIFLGFGGLFHEDDMASLVGGIGADYMINDMISFDFRVKDMYHSKGRNDVIPSIGLNFHFGKAPAPVKATPKAEERKDSDGDGVYDEDDACPDTPKGTTVNSAGCMLDTDGDGVSDDKDQCMTTPKGMPVDATGCTPDTDGDGVYDFEDRCPNTMKGVKVNSAGCFVSATLKINFKTNSAAIDEDYLEDIQKFAVFMKANSHIKAEIQGHTDSKGAAEYNLQLSQKRAESVVDILVKKYGVSADRLTAVGYGENVPLVPNDSPANMLKNRRIDTVVK
ncbi:MAG: OmpA family protein [Deferribacterales bacterium]|jgi:OOP family OmpA-OmpF porin